LQNEENPPRAEKVRQEPRMNFTLNEIFTAFAFLAITFGPAASAIIPFGPQPPEAPAEAFRSHSFE
jgi:hypothetical protein